MTEYIYRTKMSASGIHLRYRECAANLIIDPNVSDHMADSS